MKNLLTKICLGWVYLAGIALLAVILVTVINVSAFGLDKIARSFGSNVSGLPGYEDFIRLLMSCIALMFFPWTQLKQGHIAVDFLANRFSEKLQRVLDAFWNFITLLFVGFLIYFMYLGMLESKSDNALSPVLGWVEWPFFIPGLISLFLWGLVIVYQLINSKEEF